MLSNFLFSKPKNVGNAKCRPTINRVSTNYWPIHRSSIDQLSAKCRWTKSYIGWDTSGTTIDRVSTECRSTIDRLSTAISTDCRPSVDWLSTECRPLYRPISRSTLPTVNKIPHFLNGHQFLLRLLVELLISFPKVLVAAVNGNALGFGTALLGLCDVVYASNKVCSYIYSFQNGRHQLLFFNFWPL